MQNILNAKICNSELMMAMAMAQRNKESLAGAIGGVILILLTTTPALLQLEKKTHVSRSAQKKSGQVYEDKDGAATEASEAAYSATLPLCLICAFSLLGFVVSTTLAILVTLDITRDGMFIENWLIVTAWVGLHH